MNLETIIEIQSWYKIWQLNWFNLIRAKPKLLKKQIGAYESFSAVRKAESHLHWQFIRTWQILWRSFLESLYVNVSFRNTNRTAERAVRRIKEGTSAVLLQSGLEEKWWADAMECYCYLRNLQDLLSHGQTPYEPRFGEPFQGPISPFGSYYPISARDQSRLHQSGKNVIFLGYTLFAVRFWKGDIVDADIEEAGKLDASEIHARRLNAKEIVTPKRWELFKIPDRRWNSKIVWKRSWSPRINFNVGPTWREWRYQWKTSRRTGGPQLTETQDDAETGETFGLLKVTSSIVITMNLEFNSVCRKKRHSLIH